MTEAGARPAPAMLRVLELVNTRGPDGDGIATPAALTGWLRAHGMVPPEVTATAEQHARALVLREGLRAILAENNLPPPAARRPPSRRPDGLDPAARPAFAALTRGLPLVLSVTSGPPRLVAREEGTVDGALASMLALVADAVASGTWSRAKVCQEPSCRWAYYDRSRNRSRSWCSMDVCGNRSKARTFRSRTEPPP
jgi:predicted RNA-binding Zn ribbon-like protein